MSETATAVHVDKRGATAWLLLDRPDKRNALNQSMWEAVIAHLQRLADDPSIKVLVLASASLDVFSAGADIAEFEAIGADPQRALANAAAIRDSHRLLGLFPKPTIAAVAGPCVGGGCGLALACDMRIAAETARFAIPPARLGLVYSLQDTKRLVDLVGPAESRRMLFTGHPVDAQRALRTGLVNDVVPVETLVSAVTALADELTANSQYSIRQSKRIIQMILDGVADDTPETTALFAAAFEGPDHLEGRAAFLGKRKAKFPVR
jgi:enoyl-CoA hydratase/carnithine racemase